MNGNNICPHVNSIRHDIKQVVYHLPQKQEMAITSAKQQNMAKTKWQ